MPNVILLIVDTLRYDRLGVSGYRPAVTPHLDALATGGVNCPNHFANGCVTSVAFPSMFTSSLPFDYGGYDEGIRNRPVSFPELLRDAGYETWGVVTGHPCSSHFGYGRGFENLLDLIDLYQWFRSVYIASLRELRDLRHSGEITESELIVRFAPKFRRVLDDSERFIDELDRVKAPRSGRPRQTLRAMVRAERIVFESDPMASWTKIDVLGPDYQFALGEAVLTPNRRHRIFRRKSLFARINQRIHLVSNRRAFDAGEVNRQFGQFLANARIARFLHFCTISTCTRPNFKSPACWPDPHRGAFQTWSAPTGGFDAGGRPANGAFSMISGFPRSTTRSANCSRFFVGLAWPTIRCS